MIDPSLITFLAWIPIVLVVLGVYWLFLWFLPKIFCDTYGEATKSIFVSHIILFLIIGLIVSIYWFTEEKDNYTTQYIESQK